MQRKKQRRRKYISLLLTGLLVVSTAAFTGAFSGLAQTSDVQPSDNASDDDWATHRADEGRTGATAGTGPAGPYANTEWKANSTGTVEGATVSGDTVYVGVTTFLEYYGDNGAVTAYDAETGEVRWNQSELRKPNGAPTVSDGTVYVATNAGEEHPHLSAGGKGGLFALDAETGEIEWQNNETTWLGSPIVVGDRLYAITGDNVSVVDVETGERITTLETGLEDSTDGDTNVHHTVEDFAVVDGSVYLSVETATETDDDNEYVINYTYSGSLISLDATDGSHEWTQTADSEVVGMAVADGKVYWTLQPDTVQTYSAEDGTLHWQKQLGYSVDNVEPARITAPAVDDGTVYVGIDDNEYEYGYYDGSGKKNIGAIYALDGQNGQEQWRFETAATVDSAPVLTDDSVFFGAVHTNEQNFTRHSMYALSRDDGTEQWSYATEESGSAHLGSVIPANDRLYTWAHYKVLYPQYGEYRMYALNVSDERPDENHRLADDSVGDQNIAPNVVVTSDNERFEGSDRVVTAVEGGKTVVLNASLSSDSDGEIVSYEWDADGDGEYETSGKTVEVTVPECETVTVNLRVTDDDGGVSTGSAELRGT